MKKSIPKLLALPAGIVLIIPGLFCFMAGEAIQGAIPLVVVGSMLIWYWKR